MKKLFFLLFLVVLAITLPVVLLQFTETYTATVTTPPPSPQSEVNGPTLEEKVGQLFVIGHWTQTPAEATAKIVDEHHIGGVILMDAPEDVSEIKQWTMLWQNVSYPSPLLVGIDQEGGVVSRLKDEVYVQTPQPDISSETQAYEVASERARALTTLGINQNFSPVIDQSSNPDSFMFDRVFRDSNRTAVLADSMIRGYQDNRVLASPKHYPGHPDIADDSHLTLPILDVSKEQYLKHTEQFSELISAGNTKILMTAHILVPSIDPDYPATLSPVITTDLRERLQYDGVVVTDDLIMQAISNTWSYEESAVLALQAGADMLMLAAEPEFAGSTIEAVLDAIKNGELPEERISEAYERVQRLKEFSDK